MDYNIILLLTLASLVALVLMVLAGLVLPARSYTALLELIRELGSLVVQQQAEHRLAVTNLSAEMAALRLSAAQNGIHTMPGSPDTIGTANGIQGIK